MKRMLIGASVAMCLLTQALPAAANESACGAGIPSVNVLPGESLWKYKQDQWPTLVAMNPQLGETWRKFTLPKSKGGGPGVKLTIGEPICGVTRDSTGVIVPVESVPQSATVVPFIEEHPIKAGIGGLIAALLLAYLALWALVTLARRKDPVTSGYPVVPGGVHSVEAASARFNEQVAVRHPGRSFRILSVVEGTGTGDMMVSYGNRQRPQPRRMNDERIYQARVRFDDDGSEELLFMLERCGNDLWRHGGLLRYVPRANFRFAPDTVREPAPVPTPAVAAAEPVAPPAPEPVPVPVAANEALPTPPEAPVTPSDKAVFACYGENGRPRSIEFDHHTVDVVVGRDGRTTISFLTAPAADVSAPAEAPATERRA